MMRHMRVLHVFSAAFPSTDLGSTWPGTYPGGGLAAARHGSQPRRGDRQPLDAPAMHACTVHACASWEVQGDAVLADG